MPNYLRNRVAGGTYFFTVVTAERRPIFAEAYPRTLLGHAIRAEMEYAPFEQYAVVLLPDHFHAIWMLPPYDTGYSLRMKRIKERFTRSYLAAGGAEADRSQWSWDKGQRGVWQARFWEHTVGDENDLTDCLDYVHWNPVKHGLVQRPCDYRWSTFHKFVRLGAYDPLWGTGQVTSDITGAEWDG